MNDLIMVHYGIRADIRQFDIFLLSKEIQDISLW